jgi:hypothetical protein
MKTYDYKDETKDVRGKVIIHADYLIALIINHLFTALILNQKRVNWLMLTKYCVDWAFERDQRAPANAERPEERRHADHS